MTLQELIQNSKAKRFGDEQESLVTFLLCHAEQSEALNLAAELIQRLFVMKIQVSVKCGKCRSIFSVTPTEDMWYQIPRCGCEEFQTSIKVFNK